jgi:hypothetical protein
MDWHEHPDPLARREDMTPPETARSNAALRDYALMGAGRDLRSLHQKYAEQMSWWKEQTQPQPSERFPGVQRLASNPLAQKPPTDKLNTLFTWSDKHEWQARVKRWDELQARKAEEAYEQERIEMRKLRRDAAQGAMRLSTQMLVLLQQHKMKPRVGPDGVEYPPQVVGETTMKDAVSTLDKAASLVRREYGDDVDQVDVTSGGKPIAITEIVVERPKDANDG